MEEEESASPSSSRRPSTVSSPFAIHPRILRSDSASDDDSDIPPVLRFPIPPSTIPSAPVASNRSLPKRAPVNLKPVFIPPPPPTLKSCFDDDDDDVDVVPPQSPRRSPPTTSKPAAASSTKPLSLLKKATNVLKTSSQPHSPRSAAFPSTSSPTEKPLPKVPRPSRSRTPYDEPSPTSVSPTPSLSSSSSSSDFSASSTTMPYIPVGSIIPAPAIVQDLDDYLETLEMYFPPELWEDRHEHGAKPCHSLTPPKSTTKSSGHRARTRVSSGSTTSTSSCSRSSSEESLRSKSSFDGSTQRLKPTSSAGDMRVKTYFTSTSSTSVRVSSPLTPTMPAGSCSRRSNPSSSEGSPASTAYSSSPTSSSTITPGSRTPSPTFAKPTPVSAPKSILKSSKSTPLLRVRSPSVDSAITSISPPPVPRRSTKSSMSPASARDLQFNSPLVKQIN